MELYVASVVKVATLLRLTAGIYAIQAPGVPLTVERAARYAVAATYFAERAGLDPYELAAVARNESDFVETMRGPDGKDCGLLQTRVTVTRYSCRALLHSYWLDFQEGAREISEYARSCRGHADFDRCRLNRYNSGIRYARSGFHGAYWLRVECFTEAARRGIVVGQSCRTVRSRGDVARVLGRSTRRAHPMGRADS